MGHGHVIPNKDGSMARCDGPPICPTCNWEKSQLDTATAEGFDPASIPVPNPPKQINLRPLKLVEFRGGTLDKALDNLNDFLWDDKDILSIQHQNRSGTFVVSVWYR